MAAEKVTPEAINFMAKYGRGLICLTLTEEQGGRARAAAAVGAQKAAARRSAPRSPSRIEARRGVTTGISAKDRAHHHPDRGRRRGARPRISITPGHVFPLRAKRGGVLVRTGQTEGSVDLARLAGLSPAGVICEIMNDDGTMARMPDLERFAVQHELRILSIADLIEYRLQQESLVERAATAPLMPTLAGRVGRLHGARVHDARREDRVPGAHARRRALGRAGPGARADRVLSRRRLRLGGVRLRRAAGARRCSRSSARGAACLLYVIPSGRHSLARRLQGARPARGDGARAPGASTSCATSASARRCCRRWASSDLRL